jgi:dihydroneopterin aldolase
MEGPPFLLLEAAAEQLAQKLLAHEPRLSAVQLYIRKPHVAVPGPLEALGEPVCVSGVGGISVGLTCC